MQNAAWFAAGIGLGIASTWLIATPRGRRARRNLARRVDQGCDELQRTTRDVKEKMTARGMEMVDSGRQFVKEAGAELGKRMRFAS